MKCNICGRTGSGVDSLACDQCVYLKEALSSFSPKELIIVTDGSFNDQNNTAAGGIIIADRNENLIHTMGVLFVCHDSNVAELFAINKAHLLVPEAVVWADNYQAVQTACDQQIKMHQYGRFEEFKPWARLIPSAWRNGLHELAHQVANMARKGQWKHHPQLESMYEHNRKSKTKVEVAA